MTKNDGVRDLHHGGLQMQRENQTSVPCIVHLFFKERIESFFAHEHAVNDLASQQGKLGFQDQGFTALGDQFHFDITRFVQGHGLLTMVEVAVLHMGHMGA